MKCSILEKLTESELFTLVVIGTRRLRTVMPLKACLQKGNANEIVINGLFDV